MNTCAAPRRQRRRFRPASTVPAEEVLTAIQRVLHERDWSHLDFDRACVDRYQDDPFPMHPGEGQRALKDIARQQRVGIRLADRLLVVLELHLHLASPSYARQCLLEVQAEDARTERRHPAARAA